MAQDVQCIYLCIYFDKMKCDTTTKRKDFIYLLNKIIIKNTHQSLCACITCYVVKCALLPYTKIWDNYKKTEINVPK